MNDHDKQILRDLAKTYMEIASLAIQNERRNHWANHFSLRPVRPPVKVAVGYFNKWCMDYFGDPKMECRDELARRLERQLRMGLFQHTIGDDTILEPWLTIPVDWGNSLGGLWGLESHHIPPETKDGAWKYDPALKELGDAQKLQVPHHIVNEETTRATVEPMQEAVGNILPINIHRGPRCLGFRSDLITSLCMLRGLQNVMADMVENSKWLHSMMAFMRDGVLTNHQEAEDAGDFSLASHVNQAQPYCHELEWPKANSGPRKRKDLWCFCAAQEMTLVSPQMHEEFVLQYQLPIISRFGLVHYGCCENLTHKIDMLGKIQNLRSIAVAPTADVARCAEQIQDRYAFSWRPNPTDMVCGLTFDENRIRRILREGLAVTKGCHLHIHLKDIETLNGDPRRLPHWVKIVQDELDKAGY